MQKNFQVVLDFLVDLKSDKSKVEKLAKDVENILSKINPAIDFKSSGTKQDTTLTLRNSGRRLWLSLGEAGFVRVEITDIMGRSAPLTAEYISGGTHEIAIPARFLAGIYIISAFRGSEALRKKVAVW